MVINVTVAATTGKATISGHDTGGATWCRARSTHARAQVPITSTPSESPIHHFVATHAPASDPVSAATVPPIAAPTIGPTTTAYRRYLAKYRRKVASRR